MLNFVVDRGKAIREKVTPLHQWSTPLQAVLDQPPSALPWRLAVGGLGFAIAFSSWAWLGRINEVAQAQGRLVPQGEPYKIHSIESGKIAQLFVKEGQTVKVGQVLAKLDTTLAETEVTRLEKRLSDSQTELRQMQGLLERSQLEAAARRIVAQSAVRVQEVELAQAQSAVETTQTMLENLRDDASEQVNRLDRLKPLQQEGAIAVEQVFQVEQAVRDRTRTIIESEGNLQKSQSEVQRLSEMIAQQDAEAKRIEQESLQQIQNIQLRITELNANINETEALLANARVKQNQGFLYAPVNGVVSNLNVSNVGEVIQAGQTIAEILPASKPLILSTIVQNQEAGLIKSGMTVQVKFDAYPYQDYGTVSGKVISISPDSQPHPQLGQVYRAQIKLDQNYVTKDRQKIFFKPGQTAIAEIVTRDRRIADVLFDPIKQLQNNINL